jgi:hypothetical protein
MLLYRIDCARHRLAICHVERKTFDAAGQGR